MQIEILKLLYKSYKEKLLFGRYIYTKSIEPLLENLPSIFKVDSIAKSVRGEKIYSITIGKGEKKVLMWSQMHGNESTTTKALFDIFNILSDSNTFTDTILNNCTLKIIPILNPDGAVAYTRFTANGIDLNRDAQDLSQPESLVLRKYFDAFKPDFCFNLHDQRTIFSAGKTNNPATVSFLSPAQDESCSLTQSRTVAMEIIAEMNNVLQKQIPNQVGIYSDAFNINCVGDTFQSHNVPTILFEAGHYKNDYPREKTREYIFQSLLTALKYIAENSTSGNNYEPYFDIPKNEKCFYDVIIRNAKVKIKRGIKVVDIGFLYQERLKGDSIEFVPKIENISNLSEYYGHKEINANKNRVLSVNSNELKMGHENDFVLINNSKISLIIK
ncbi:MAG: peptidase M14 [Flavobacteriaceae bacterium]|nr:peptidase M14 [Flavobacteriaceae bacterium]